MHSRINESSPFITMVLLHNFYRDGNTEISIYVRKKIDYFN